MRLSQLEGPMVPIRVPHWNHQHCLRLGTAVCQWVGSRKCWFNWSDSVGKFYWSYSWKNIEKHLQLRLWEIPVWRSLNHLRHPILGGMCALDFMRMRTICDWVNSEAHAAPVTLLEPFRLYGLSEAWRLEMWEGKPMQSPWSSLWGMKMKRGPPV